QVSLRHCEGLGERTLLALAPAAGLRQLALETRSPVAAGVHRLLTSNAGQRLERLEAEVGPMAEDAFFALGDLPSLRALRLDGDRLGDEALGHVGRCQALRDLSVRSPRATTSGLAS